MCYKNWMGILTALAIAAMPASVSAEQKTFQLIHWTKALQTENKRVDNQGSASVFGVSVSAHIDRISAQAHANKKIKNFFSYLRTYKKASDASIRQCQANYETLKSAVQHNQLFSHYALTAVSPQDFCRLSAKEVAYLERLFKGTASPIRARQYKSALLLTMYQQKKYIWFAVEPQNKLITLVYNNPDDLKEISGLSGGWKQLAVK